MVLWYAQSFAGSNFIITSTHHALILALGLLSEWYDDVITWKPFPYYMLLGWPVSSRHKGSTIWSFYVLFVVSLNKLLNKQSNANNLRYHDTHETSLFWNCVFASSDRITIYICVPKAHRPCIIKRRNAIKATISYEWSTYSIMQPSSLVPTTALL